MTDWPVLARFSLALYLLGLVGFLWSYSLEGTRWFLRRLDRRRRVAPALGPNPPLVTVQLPIYNEFYVVERLIDGCRRIDYPRERLDIQVLDDSTDETTALIERLVAESVGGGLRISHLRRTDRSGFKAGNLQSGLASAAGEYLAIFDADSVPDSDFLLRTLPWFDDGRVGIVQPATRRANRGRSVMTRAQDPLGVPADDPTQCSTGHYLNVFSGSAVVLRKQCVMDAGGWAGDTLAEDADLSVRAFLHGWRCVKVPQALASDDVPESMAAFKSRLARCNQGPAECCRKHLVGTLTRATLSPLQKLSVLPALFCPWLSMTSVALMAVASVPLVATSDLRTQLIRFVLGVPALAVAIAAIVVAAHRHRSALAATVLLYVGTCVGAAAGVARGLLGIRTPFARTPKGWDDRARVGVSGPRYSTAATPATFLEGALALYFLLGVYVAIEKGAPWLALFPAVFVVSCTAVFALSVTER